MRSCVGTLMRGPPKPSQPTVLGGSTGANGVSLAQPAFCSPARLLSSAASASWGRSLCSRLRLDPSKVLVMPVDVISHRAHVRSVVSVHGAAARVLYVVSTPIGNSGDITRRAARILSTVDVIAAEDTRRTGVLLADILKDTPRNAALVSCHAHNWRARAPMLVERLRAGESVAVVTDAGTPAVSDPGAELVRAAVEAGIRVVPVPGACAALAALVCAGLPTGIEFVIAGFLPRRGRERKDALERLALRYAEAAAVLYEAPHRLRETLRDLAEVERRDSGRGGGLRSVCLAREVTKKYEEFLRFPSVREAADYYGVSLSNDATQATFASELSREPRGEFTIVLGPRTHDSSQGEHGHVSPETLIRDGKCNVHELISGLVAAGVPVSTIAKAVSASSGLSKKTVYSYADRMKCNLSS